jgi:hypothetical protein
MGFAVRCSSCGLFVLESATPPVGRPVNRRDDHVSPADTGRDDPLRDRSM